MNYFIFILAIVLTGCTDTERARLGALGDTAHIVCYSGGTVIYDGYSTGRVHSPEGSDGWVFKDKSTRRLMEVSGDCILAVGE